MSESTNSTDRSQADNGQTQDTVPSVKLYVVIPNYGYEGLGEPLAAFKTRAEAELYVQHVAARYTDPSVYEVPLMRFVPAKVVPVEGE